MFNFKKLVFGCLLFASQAMQANEDLFSSNPDSDQSNNQVYPFARTRYPYCHLTDDQLHKILAENPDNMHDYSTYRNRLRIIVIQSGLIPNPIDIEMNIEQSFRDIYYEILLENPRKQGESTTEWKNRIELIKKKIVTNKPEQKKYYPIFVKTGLALGIIGGMYWYFKKYKKNQSSDNVKPEISSNSN